MYISTPGGEITNISNIAKIMPNARLTMINRDMHERENGQAIRKQSESLTFLTMTFTCDRIKRVGCVIARIRKRKRTITYGDCKLRRSVLHQRESLVVNPM